MMEYLKEYVINIAILTVIIVLFEIITPSGKIKKIIYLISGFILIIASPTLAG